MKRGRFNTGLITIITLATVLAGCGATQTPLTIPTAAATLSPTRAPTTITSPPPTMTPIPPSPTRQATPTQTLIPPSPAQRVTPYPKSLADWTTYSNLNGITGLAFDQQGQLWVSSSRGATRWDVRDPANVTYTIQQDLTGRRVNAVAVGRDGSAWFATTDGVFRSDGVGWTQYGWDDGLGTEWIQTVAVTPDGTVWAGTLRAGVSRFEGDQWTTYRMADGLVDDSVRAVAMAPDGAYWFGTCALWGPASAEPPRCYGVSRFDPTLPESEAWSTYSEEDGLAFDRVNDIDVAPDGALWFATIPLSWEEEDIGKGGVSRFDGTTWTTYTTTHGLASNWVNAVAAAPDGTLWFGTDSGLSRFDPTSPEAGAWTTYTVADGLAGNKITALAVAPDGALWVGTTSGLSRFDGATWQRYTLPGPAAGAVMAIAAGPDGSIWFGSGQGQPAPDDPGRGVTRFDPASPAAEAWTTYTAADGLAANTVLALAVGADGTAWFAASDQGYIARGVSRFDGQTWKTFTAADGLASGDVSAIATAPDGTVWFGTYSDGVSRFDPSSGSTDVEYEAEAWTTYTRDDGLPSNSISTIAVASDGTVWIGCWSQGTASFDGQEWREFRAVGGSVTSLAVAPDGTVWFGTFGDGVSCFDGRGQTYYDTADGLIDDYVNAIAVAPDGAVWFGTNSGVSRFDGQTWTSFTRTDGLVDNCVTTIAVAPDGALWFGTYSGVSRYLPSW